MNNDRFVMIVIWAIISMALSLWMVMYNPAPFILGATFMGKVIAWILGSILGVVGAMIGKIVKELVLTNSLIIWLLIPFIGCCLGVALGFAIVLH